MPTETKPKTKPIPVRMDTALRDRTTRAAARLGLTRAGLVKLALTCKLGEIEAGKLTLN